MWGSRRGLRVRNEYEKQAVIEEDEEREEVKAADTRVLLRKEPWEG